VDSGLDDDEGNPIPECQVFGQLITQCGRTYCETIPDVP